MRRESQNGDDLCFRNARACDEAVGLCITHVMRELFHIGCSQQKPYPATSSRRADFAGRAEDDAAARCFA